MTCAVRGALLVAQAVGSVMLGVASLAPSFPLYLVTLFFWGACGGVAMTMSRTIMQEQAPDAQRGRVMSFYSFSFFGAGPIGALLNGFLVDQVGPQAALLICGCAMFTIATMISLMSSLWRLDAQAVAAATAMAGGAAASAPQQRNGAGQ